MRLSVFTTTLLFACLAAGMAVAQEFRPLGGRYALTASNMVDPMPDEKPDRVVMFVEGKAAEDMYNGMTQKPAKDRCSGDAVSKKAGNLICSRLDSGKFFCTFGVGLRDGRLLSGRAC